MCLTCKHMRIEFISHKSLHVLGITLAHNIYSKFETYLVSSDVALHVCPVAD
jgi:hypothetical protein